MNKQSPKLYESPTAISVGQESLMDMDAFLNTSYDEDKVRARDLGDLDTSVDDTSWSDHSNDNK